MLIFTYRGEVLELARLTAHKRRNHNISRILKSRVYSLQITNTPLDRKKERVQKTCWLASVEVKILVHRKPLGNCADVVVQVYVLGRSL